jgi:polyhydroxyalkanoate synthesis regulator phasin
MSNDISVSNEPPDEPRRAVAGSVGTAFLASVGAFGVVVEKLGGALDRLVSDETRAEVETRGVFGRVVRWPAKTARSAVRVTGQQVDRGLDATFGALNVPRKSDVDRLNERIAELSRKLDEVYNHNGQ